MTSENTQSRILVVDDERTARLSLAEILRLEGYEVVAVEGGEEAILFLKAQEFDLVLCDLKMPDVDGLQVLDVCREFRPATEFILLTAYGTLDTAVEALRHGASDYLLDRRTASQDGQALSLTPTEFQLLAYLMTANGSPVTAEELVVHVQGYRVGPEEARALMRVHVSRLRQKVEVDPAEPRIILTVRGVGYAFGGAE